MVFFGMFLVVEIIFGSILGILGLSSLPLYKDVQIFSDYPSLAYVIVLLEIIGCGGFLYLFNKLDKKKYTNILSIHSLS